ncbi:sensor histidine kinase [Thalassoroseus pseudoceratinae]|uniref:sensor histidine kinase n=1 Tax=Thalassoroseus pseudoceratinae TaxID=2713176 RepID=UPI00142350E6|nr:HAMP domain-containing sensor histidine kinase [Thalassoroseus pseudoceratinae]
MRSRLLWSGFFASLTVVTAALVWISQTVLELESAERDLVRQSESNRLALWRMDSFLVPLIARESGRSASAYRLRSEPTEFVKLRFEFRQENKYLCVLPNAPKSDTAEIPDVLCEAVESKDFLEQIQNQSPNEFAVRDEEPPLPQQFENAPPEPLLGQANTSYQQLAAQEVTRNQNEFRKRSQNVLQSNSTIMPPAMRSPEQSPEDLEILGPMQGVWQDGLLLLVRPVSGGGAQFVQGCWLDWEAIRTQMLDDIRDLLPSAELVPSRTAEDGLQLAALPLRLTPGLPPTEILPVWTPLRVSLLIAWGCWLVAAIAVGWVLYCAIRLSERRGAFVSAVTHELRTPLTTFRLYTEMLVDGMVPSDEKRQHYLQTLRVEAERLGHLVENVLSYARLENTRRPDAVEEISVEDFLLRLQSTLQERAVRSDRRLVFLPYSEPLHISADAAAVERILFNLVDNACKYGGDAMNSQIEISARRDGHHVVIAVRDYGPGVSRRQVGRLFRPFSKSASEAAHSAPGVGLGLALSKRLARRMGGDLRCDQSVDQGACFQLTLPRSTATVRD